MEPFGVFQFLQSLMNFSPASDSQKKENPNPETADFSTEQKTENVPKKETAPQQNSSAQEAALHFLMSHETRASRTRRKKP